MERVIIKVKKKMPPDCMESIAKRIREQYESGLVTGDDNVDIFIVSSNEKEAKREKRLAKIKAEKEKIEALATVYEDLKEGELFRITSDLKDKRVYRRDKDGSTQIVDSYGNCCNYKAYPYLTMRVYKV